MGTLQNIAAAADRVAERGHRVHLAWRLVLGCLIAFTHLSCEAVPARPLSLLGYQRTSWGQKDGAPAGIQAMARTSDGWLWLGTNSGLYQFDGVSFSPRETLPLGNLHSRSISRLLSAPNGDLWVFFSAGGASVLRRNDRDHPVWIVGLPDGTPIDSVAEDDQSSIWITAGSGIYQSRGDRWEQINPAEVGLPEDRAPTVLSDHRGNIWYCTDTRVYVRPPHSTQFNPVAGNWRSIRAFVVSAQGGMSVIDGSTSPTDVFEQLPVPRGSNQARLSAMSEMSMRDSYGVMWSVACNHGDLCISPPASAQKRSITEGQIDPWKALGEIPPGTMTLLIDEQGNTWVGTKKGLVQFRAAAATPVRFPNGTYFFSVVPNADGTVYVGTDSRSSDALDQLWRVSTDASPQPLLAHAISAAWQESKDSILLAGAQGLLKFDGKKGYLEKWPQAATIGGTTPQSMAEDSAGRLWVAFRDFPPWRRGPDGWHERGGIADLPHGLVALIVPSGSDTWLGYRNNTLIRVDAKDHLSQWDQRQGLLTGSVTALVTGVPVLVGGERGLQWFDGKKFHSIQAAHADELTGITGLLHEPDGSLWVNGFRGLVHYSADTFSRALSDENFLMEGRIYDEGDGVQGTAQQTRPLPTLTRGTDNKIWVASTNGLSWIDSSSIPTNIRPPLVEIADINSSRELTNGMHFSAGTRQLRIGFHVLSLTRPDRTQVRYRLVGIDRRWTDAGNKRDAVFENLGPGNYRFELIASNEDGIWTKQPARLEFSIEPTFFQTAAFKLICLVVGLGAIWLAFALRLRHERRRMREKMAVRHAERERIARELHDTLLQGISGLLMRMQVWSGHRGLPSDLQGDMVRATDQGRQMLIEGRDRIAELRTDDDNPVMLSNAISAIGERLSTLHGTRFTLQGETTGLALRHDVGEDVVAMVHEAISNAHAHAGASSIDITLSVRGAHLSITVADDGRGITKEEIDGAGKTGHWGLVGMRERARRIGARFTIVGGERGGTKVVFQGIRLSRRLDLGQ